MRYFIITQQAMTQAKDIPGITDFVAKQINIYERFDELILQAQNSGEVIDEDPSVLSSAYLALFHGLVLMAQHQNDLKEKVTPEIFNNLLRKNH